MLKLFWASFFVLLSSCGLGINDNKISIALSSKIPSLDPAKAYDTLSSSVMYQSYEPLYEFHYLKRPYTIKPLLAESMPLIEDNGKKYTIKLKRKIPYHPDPSLPQGRTVVAEDFITQIKRLAFEPTQSPGWWIFDNRIKGINNFRKKVGNNFSKLESTKIPGFYAKDKYTLVIELNEPFPQLIYALAMHFSAPMPIEAVKYYHNNFDANFVSTGPFYPIKIDLNKSIHLKRFSNYRAATYPANGDRVAHVTNLISDANKSIPFLDSIDFLIIPEANDRWAAFVNKKIDMLVLPKDKFNEAIDGTGNLTPILQNENVKLQVSPTLTFWWIGFNMTSPILGKKLKIRKAIAHAIDIDKFIATFTNNIALRANSIYPPGIPGYDPSKISPYSYDPELAKKILKQEGYSKKHPLKLTYDSRGNNKTNFEQAQFIQNELQKVGINIKINLNSFSEFLVKSKKNSFQLFQGGWSLDYPDAENVLQLLTTANHPPGPNTSHYSNPTYDQLFNKISALPNGDQKFQLMKKIEKIQDHDLPWIMLFYSRRYVLYHQHVKNLRSSDVINNYLKYIKVD